MPAPKTAAARLTAKGLTPKQRACTHPPQHVHPTYDERWETCDLCHIIRPRPLPAPWIVEWDESQPAEEAPALFAEPQPAPTPTRTRHHIAAIVRERPQTFGDLLRAARRDRALLGRQTPWQSPPLDELYTPDQIQTCPRCRGAGTIADNPYKDSPSLADTVRYEPAPPRPCPRCQGAGRIPKYIA